MSPYNLLLAAHYTTLNPPPGLPPNFAKCGDPNGADDNSLGWAPCTTEAPQFMLFKLDEADAEASAMGDPIIPKVE